MKKALLYVVLTAVCLFFVFIYRNFDPSENNWFPECLLRKATGFLCPACGTQRAVHCLLNGDISSALEYNAFIVIMIPVLFLLAVSGLFKDRLPRLDRFLCSKGFIMSVAAAVLVWWIIRNLFDK